MESLSEGRKLYKTALTNFTARPDTEKHKVGLALLKRASALGYLPADEWLGAAYDYGLGTKPNLRRPVRSWLLPEQRRGHAS
jgi:hypothetical protein